MKKIMTGLLLFSSFNICYANHFIYGGLGAGIDIFTPDRKVIDTITQTPPIPNLISTNYNSDNGVGGTLNVFLGVEQQFAYQPYLLGLELAAAISSAEAKAKTYYYANLNVNAAASIRNKGNVSFSLLPGYQINENSHVFLRAGVSRAQFEIKSSADTGGNLIATGKTSRWKSGVILGAGLETTITSTMNARVEYNYSQYGKITQTSVIPASVNPNNDIIQSTVTPYDHTVMLSMVFHHFL